MLCLSLLKKKKSIQRCVPFLNLHFPLFKELEKIYNWHQNGMSYNLMDEGEVKEKKEEKERKRERIRD